MSGKAGQNGFSAVGFLFSDSLLVAGCLCWLFIKYAWRNLEATVKKTIVLSAIYVLVGSCVVIAARTRYQWGELISIRHTLQYTPFLLAILLVPVLGYATGRFTKILRILKVVLVIALALFHINYALFSESFQARNNDYPILLNAYKTGENFLCVKGNGENNVFLVSNWAYVFRIECAARVRQIEPVIDVARNKDMLALIAANEGNDGLMAAIVDIKNHSIGRPIHIGFFPGRFGMEASDFPLPNADQQKLLDSGWAIIRNDEHGLLVQYPQGTIE
jgi:hypothetical protein